MSNFCNVYKVEFLTVFCMIIIAFTVGFLVGFDLKSNEKTIITHTSKDFFIKDTFIANKKGSVYYPWWCDKLPDLDNKNKIFFHSEKDAIEKGYRKTKSCKY